MRCASYGAPPHDSGGSPRCERSALWPADVGPQISGDTARSLCGSPSAIAPAYSGRPISMAAAPPHTDGRASGRTRHEQAGSPLPTRALLVFLDSAHFQVARRALAQVHIAGIAHRPLAMGQRYKDLSRRAADPVGIRISATEELVDLVRDDERVLRPRAAVGGWCVVRQQRQSTASPGTPSAISDRHRRAERRPASWFWMRTSTCAGEPSCASSAPTAT